MTAYALPRLRTRRRKIKPPHPLWFLAVLFSGCSLVVASNAARALPRPSAALYLAAGALSTASWWPQLRSPYSAWLPESPVLALSGIACAVAAAVLDVAGL